MSLSQTVTKAVDEVIHTFIQQLSNKYNLDSNELLAEWEGNSTAPKKSFITDIPSVNDDIDPDDLLKYKKPELQALCRQRGIKCTGTKVELVGYLLGKKPSTKKPVTTKNVTPVNKAATTPVAKKLTSKVPTVAIRRNQWGNHEHPETSFIFDKKTQKVIGKQGDLGKVLDLTSEDLEVCIQMKFKYILPDNLDKKAKLDEEKVEELDNDDNVSDEEEEILMDEEELIEDEDFEEDFEEEEEYEEESE
jgi:hypothetical protein